MTTSPRSRSARSTSGSKRSAGTQAVASFPLASQDFETTTFAQGFYPVTSYEGIAGITTEYPRSGTRSVVLKQLTKGSAIASLILAVDLSGQTDVYLDFWIRSTGWGYRRIYISDNSGATWTEIQNLDAIGSSFSHEVIDLVAAATGKGRILNSSFQIKFEHSTGNVQGDPGDGMVIDDIQVHTAQPLVRIYLPQVIR